MECATKATPAACGAADDSDVVKVGETVVLLLNDGAKLFVVARPGESVRLKKASFEGNLLVGAAYGTVYDVTPKRTIELVESGELIPSLDLDVGSGMDNRELVDDNTAQTLTHEEITKMKTEGKAGMEIIAALVQNSTTFAGKTAFSQEKYVRKKQQKYVTRFRVVRPTAQLICDVLLEKQPDKMCGLRSDSLAQLLTAANIHVGGRALVVDAVSGVLVGAVAERMGDSGTIISVEESHRLTAPAWAHTQKYNLGRFVDTTQPRHLNVFTVSMQNLADWAIVPAKPSPAPAVSAAQDTTAAAAGDVMPAAGHKRPRPATDESVPAAGDVMPAAGHKRPRPATDESAPAADDKAEAAKPHKEPVSSYHLIKAQRKPVWQKCADLLQGVDSVVIVSDFHPLSITLAALRYAKPSASFAVFCSELQPLAELYRQLRTQSMAVNMFVSETWLREYQVLPNRTHPTMSMHGASGYVLRGVVVHSSFTLVPTVLPSE